MIVFYLRHNTGDEDGIIGEGIEEEGGMKEVLEEVPGYRGEEEMYARAGPGMLSHVIAQMPEFDPEVRRALLHAVGELTYEKLPL